VSYDYNFAVCLFPPVYWQACRHWPFDKVFMPYARHGPVVQHRLHAEIQKGLALEDFDRSLIGEGALGTDITAARATRPSPEELAADSISAQERVELIWRYPSGTIRPEGPRPPQDSVFDHLDRCEFLERFPLIKIDRAGFAELARGLDLPSWAAWVKHAAVTWRIADDRPPCSAERFAHVVSGVRLVGDADEDRPSTLDSHAARMLTQITAEAAARLLGRGDWHGFARAAEVLELPDTWQRVADAIAQRSAQNEANEAR
jgi:hypothetical protein